eukprot:4684815-Pyramimonas_sp.AAC.1
MQSGDDVPPVGGHARFQPIQDRRDGTGSKENRGNVRLERAGTRVCRLLFDERVLDFDGPV